MNADVAGGPAAVVTVADVRVTAEVPTVALTPVVPPVTLLLGWKVVVAVPVESVVAVEGLKLKVVPEA